jgi:hypothetical protein
MGLPELVEMQEMDSAQINEALIRIDALGSVFLKGLFVNDPPASPADGDTYVTGGAPTGSWSGNSYKIAYCIDGGWRVFTPFDGLVAHLSTTDSPYVYRGGQWTGLGALMAGPDVSIASAATCDLCAAGALCVLVTGTSTITSLGGGTNALRFVRFAQALALTHNATSLVLPGGADIVTAAGDTACFRSDASGNWRCIFYQPASGRMVNMTNPIFAGSVGVGGSAAAKLHTYSDALTSDAIRCTDTHAGGRTWILGPGSGTGNSSLFALAYNVTDGVAGPYINSGGNLLAGVTSAWNSPGTRIEAKGGIGISGWCTGSGDIAVQARVDNAAGYLMAGFYGTTLVGTITTNGSSASYNTTSDARLKTVPAEQGDYRAAIRALWVGDFTWTATGEKAFGVIAQQAYEHMPSHMGVMRPARAEDTWHASAEPFAHLALWGVKDLYALVERLAARVAELEARA